MFDGKANAFSTTLIENATFDLYVERDGNMIMPEIKPSDRSSGGRGGRGGNVPRPTQLEFDLTLAPANVLNEETVRGSYEKITISLDHSADIALSRLMDYTAGRCSEDESVITAATCLAVLLRHVPAMVYVNVGMNFFTPESRIPMAGGLEIWRGYHQSLRAMMAGHLGINVGLAAAVFKKGGVTVIDFLLDALSLRDINDLTRRSPAEVKSVLSGVNCTTTHRGDMKQKFKIHSITNETANTWMFDNEKAGRKVSVAEYFKEEYNIVLKYPNLPLVLKSNKKTAFPIECLSIIPGQRFMSRLKGDQISEMIRITMRKPNHYRDEITAAVKQSLKFDQNPYIQSFGLAVGNEPMKIDARVLDAPKILLKNNSLAPRDGAWNLRGSKFIDAPPLTSCAFVFFARISNRDCEDISRIMLSKFYNAGVNTNIKSCPFVVANPKNGDNAVANALKDAFGQAQQKFRERPQMLFVVLDDRDKGIYEQVKTVGLCVARVMTQCMITKHVGNPDRIKDQYCGNLAMKVNIKLGGATNKIDTGVISKVSTIFIGSDVTHPSPGSDSPSIAAVVASYDKSATKYNTYCRSQGTRVEMIASIRECTELALKDYAKQNRGQYPERIVYYRDGVSNHQFEQCIRTEVAAIKDSIIALKCGAKLTAVVVQKRHHIRFFPVDDNADRSGNCLPGTVVDTKITHPTLFSFILQSHGGLQGMSRPTLYHVIYDENKFSNDDLQAISYDLCHLCERASRTISMVSPAYRAHLAAFYARMFLSANRHGAPVLREVAVGIENTMYYM